ncbi:MAG: helix-turn-helix domain-containing protein, partial [Proteobacteria bacterium]|nr:helix-turn-helix domain-containing protein [Pseudomonadota bacterium]
MLRVTKLTDYASLVLTLLAADPQRVHSASELAERAHLEAPTVSKLLKSL